MLNNMHQKKRSLWMSFVAIAQPYFFPAIRGGVWTTLLLMILLLLFLFGLLFIRHKIPCKKSSGRFPE